MGPYDELPYRCVPIEWTAPERLAIASLLQGGPRSRVDGYRVLELGCGDGANLVAQAYYRRHATFVGVDGSRRHIEVANDSRSALNLTHLDFIHADFRSADEKLDGQFDYIVGHGIFSWVPDDVRDALLALCAKRLQPGGLLYLNYNANPGWKIRGMVRNLLLSQTAGAKPLERRARLAQDLAAALASTMQSAHPYSRLLAEEFRFVSSHEESYVAHEYLAPENHAYWRSEFLAVVRSHGLEYVGDADFNYSGSRLPDDLATRLVEDQVTRCTDDDVIDFLCYRQLHSPILTTAPLSRCEATVQEFSMLVVASCLAPAEMSQTGEPMFVHPSGYQVEVRDESVRIGLNRLWPQWPQGLPAATVFPDVRNVMDDLRLLHRNGLIDLRLVEPDDAEMCPEPLQRLEARRGDCFTTRYHTQERRTL